MKRINYKVKINKSKDVVWDTMLNPDTYMSWASAFSPNSQYKGEWKEGSFIDFFDPDMGGTRALLEEVRPYEYIQALHTAILNREGEEDRQSDIAKKWIGVTEAYSFSENDGITELTIDIETHEDFEQMFNEGWAKALPKLKAICER
jgi:hypothetical protein